MTPEEIKERAKPWLTPVAGDAPAGADMRYENEYVELKEMIAKADDPAKPPVDWNQVVQFGDTILKNQSKDILVASYHAYGLFKIKGLDGLATGLASLAEMMDAFWEDMFPAVRRKRARASAIVWLVEKMTLDLGTTQVGAGDHAGVTALQAAFDRLREVCTARFEAPPSLGALKDDIERLRQSPWLPVEALTL